MILELEMIHFSNNAIELIYYRFSRESSLASMFEPKHQTVINVKYDAFSKRTVLFSQVKENIEFISNIRSRHFARELHKHTYIP